MAFVNTLECCGWAELCGVQGYTTRTHFRRLLGAATEFPKGAFMFSSAHNVKKPKIIHAKRFARAIEKAGLGKVTALPIFLNPNTDRYIHGYIWVVDWDKFSAYCLKNNIRSVYSWW